MSAQPVPVKKYASEAERKKAYRERMKQELGLEKYLEEQRIKKQQQRAKAKGKLVDIKAQVKSEPKQSPPQPPSQNKPLKQSVITSFFKPTTKEEQKQEIIIPPTTNKKTRVVLNIKPVLKLQEKLKKQLEKVRALEDEVFNDKRILNVRPPGRPRKQLEEIKPLHVKYDSKKVESKTVVQYLSKLKTIYKKIFKTDLMPGVYEELQKLIEGKEFNQGVINHILFFKRIKFIIDEIKRIYSKKDSTVSSYLNAITSILARIPYFKEEYNIISTENNLYASKYKNKRDTNDATDVDINKLISFDPSYINKTIDDIKNINDKA